MRKASQSQGKPYAQKAPSKNRSSEVGSPRRRNAKADILTINDESIEPTSVSNSDLAISETNGKWEPLEGPDTQDVGSQALEILAGLASLGISQELRERVQSALKQLDQAAETATASLTFGRDAMAMTTNTLCVKSNTPSKLSASAEAAYERKFAAMEKKLQMSRSIMRKLYYKTVHLEKEVQIMKANERPIKFDDAQQEPVIPGTPAAAAVAAAAATTVYSTQPLMLSTSRPATAYPNAAAGQTPLSTALQNRDSTIQQLQQALDASRRRCALLESQMSAIGRAAGAQLSGRHQDQLNEIFAQSVVHSQKYRQIRDDYNRLLHKRVQSITASKAASTHAKAVVDELQQRLCAEVQEREAEAALYSARLYETERQMSDWYVEKRMLEDHISKLSEQIRERDRLDAEIETCVCSLFERLKQLEASNEGLIEQLKAAGINVNPSNCNDHAFSNTPRSATAAAVAARAAGVQLPS